MPWRHYPTYVRERVCVDCARVDVIRKDSGAIRCGRCASEIARLKGLKVLQARKLSASCVHCRESFYTTRSIQNSGNGRYCSRQCRREALNINRSCETCGGAFRVFRSLLSGKSNSAGRFCSKACYTEFLCKPESKGPRGSQWDVTRRKIRERNPACALCGTPVKLDVHHIIPFRLTRDNSIENLVPLCRKHHRKIEARFLRTESLQPNLRDSLHEWNLILEDRRLSQREKLLAVTYWGPILGSNIGRPAD